jgi:hypothetical protein
MTTEELIAAGLPLDPVVEGAEHAAPTEDSGSPSGSRSYGTFCKHLHVVMVLRISILSISSKHSACSFGWWLMAGADLF